MATNYSKLLSLINGRQQTIDFSNINNILTLGGGLQLNGSTSGNIQFTAPSIVTSYSVVWPAAQATSSGYTLSNDGTGVLTWVPASSGSVSAVSINSANGFAGTSSGGSTPALTISTSVTGILYGNGTAVAAAIPSNFPTLNQNTTGTAGNVTATTNSTITTLSALSLPGSQVTGNISGDAANITATSNSTLTTLSALSLPTSQLSGYINLTSQVANVLPVINGGTGVATATANTFFAGPASGSAAAPSFRAIVAADVPDLSGSYANTTLSNLTSPTSINQSLIPFSDDAITLGSPSAEWSTLYIGSIASTSSNAVINMSNTTLNDVSSAISLDWNNRFLYDQSVATSIDWQNRLLCDTSSATQLAWSTSGVLVNTGFSSPNLALRGSVSGNLTQTASATTTSYSVTWPAAQATGTQFLQNNGSGVLSWASAATGTVTSVAFADDSSTPIYSVSGSPVTTTGTLGITLHTQAANSVFAGPTSGSAAQPTFRALVSTDIPDISATYVTQSEVGAANGVASLDGSGKIPLAQLPNAVFVYQGTWNPSTNTPALADGTGTAGYVYYVSTAYAGTVAGLTNPSMTNFQVGDLVIYNGTQYELTTPAAGVQSVNGMQGVVTVNAINQLTGDVTAGPASGSSSQAATIASIQGTAVSGTTGTGDVVFSASPTFTGTLSGANAAFSGSINAPTLTVTAMYGDTSTLAANTTYALRWGVPANGETANELYLADWDTSSFDLFWVVGLYNSASTTSTGAIITVVSKGSLTLGSSDSAFGTSDQGRPVYLVASGSFSAYTAFSPGSGDANMKLGIAQSASIVWVDLQMMGVS